MVHEDLAWSLGTGTLGTGRTGTGLTAYEYGAQAGGCSCTGSPKLATHSQAHVLPGLMPIVLAPVAEVSPEDAAVVRECA